MTDQETFARRLQTGPGMRFQRAVEAGFLVAAILTGDVRLAWVTFISTVLQSISPWIVPVALLVAAVHRKSRRHTLGDLYFDFGGTRGAGISSVIVQAVGLWLLYAGYTAAGWIVLAVPAASFMLSPTVGFCAGCTFYVWYRNALTRLDLSKRVVHGAHDVTLGDGVADRQ